MDQAVADPMSPTVTLAGTPDFSIRDLRVRPALRLIERADGRYSVQPRVMQVLVALTLASPDVVSRDRLVAMCWDGRVVGDDALNRCIVMLRGLARDLGNAFQIENVARVGYRLVIPDEGATSGRPQLPSPLLIAFGIGLCIAALGGAGAYSAGMISSALSIGSRQDVPPEILNLVEQGETLLHTGNPQVAGDARSAFEKAVEAAPTYAPAWVGLARAERSEASLEGPEKVIAVLPKVRADLRRALDLAPDLAGAHLAMGEVMGVIAPEAQEELVRAARLDPSSVEARLAMASVHRARGDFQGEIAEYRRARQLDGNWYRPVRDLAIAQAEMGNLRAAVGLAATITFGTGKCAGPQARIAWIYGDIARSARCNTDGAKVETIWRAPARVAYQSALLTLGLSNDTRAAMPIHIVDVRPPQGRVAMDVPPTPQQWQHRNRSADAALAYRLENFVGAKMMLASGRTAELVRNYDSPIGLIGVKREVAPSAAFLSAIPIVALALQREGRRAEADRLLAAATEVVAVSRQKGEVPFTFDAEAAEVHAVAGDPERAISALTRARQRGWVNIGWGDMLDLREEPAFASLRTDPRFEEICKGLDALYERERRVFLASED